MELLLRLSRKAHDAVGRDGGVRQDGSDRLHDVEEPLAGVASPHASKDVVVAALEGYVEAGHEGGGGGHCRNDPLGHVLGMRGEEAHPLDARHVASRRKQICEFLFGGHVASPAVDVLTQ